MIKPKKAKLIPMVKTFFFDTDNDIYDDSFLDRSVEDDQISPEEQGFMMGYLGDCYV